MNSKTILTQGWTLLFALLSGIACGQEVKSVDDLAWIKGCWVANLNGREINEHWMKPAGKTMLGMSRTVANGKTAECEFIQIRQDDKGDIYFVAKPSGQTGASFKLVKSGKTEAVFENAEHDFPQRIIYRLGEDGSLLARIEGVGKGKPRAVDYPMKRGSCD